MQNTSSDKARNLSHKEGKNILARVNNLAGLPPREFNRQVKKLGELIASHPTAEEHTKAIQVDNVQHHHATGLYGRELFMPKGTVVLSRVHLVSGVHILSQGKVVMIDTHGRHEVSAPNTCTSEAGTQRLVLALEDTIWTSVHATDITDPNELFETLTTDDYEEYLKINCIEHEE